MKGKSSGRQMWRCLAVGILSMAGGRGPAGAPAAGVPDALLLAPPPPNSINERAGGTKVGLRAQVRGREHGWKPKPGGGARNPEADGTGAAIGGGAVSHWRGSFPFWMRGLWGATGAPVPIRGNGGGGLPRGPPALWGA